MLPSPTLPPCLQVRVHVKKIRFRQGKNERIQAHNLPTHAEVVLVSQAQIAIANVKAVGALGQHGLRGWAWVYADTLTRKRECKPRPVYVYHASVVQACIYFRAKQI